LFSVMAYGLATFGRILHCFGWAVCSVQGKEKGTTQSAIPDCQPVSNWCDPLPAYSAFD
jgi:hypothetical protein